MRTEKSIKNAITSILSNILAIGIGLLAQAIFIKILGIEYLGINGLFSNIISLLGIVELGIGNAIIYNLYKPIENNDKETIKTLIRVYRKVYHIIGMIVLIIGLLISPFLERIVGTVNVDVNIYIVYLLFLSEVVCSYFLSYKRSLLYADQRNYIISIIHIFYLILLNVLQLALLFYTKNFYIYLGIKVIFKILENYIITLVVNKEYNYVNEKDIKPLEPAIKENIIQKVKALFFHKIGGFVVNGTDNIIISKYLGVSIVGYYSNYFMIINAVSTVFAQALQSLIPSIGNLLVSDDKRAFEVFKRIRFINFWVATFTATCLLCMMEPFIKIWIGNQYILDSTVLYVLIFNYYQKMMRYSYSNFKEAAGIYHEDRFIPIIESLLNIVVSIFLVKKIGLAGVFIGTIVSGLALWCYSYPKYVYKNLFGRNYKQYATETIGYIFLLLIISISTYELTSLIKTNSNIIALLVSIFACIIVPNFLIICIFRKTDNFAYVKNIAIEYVKRFKKRT